ncbi:MAG TPA: magnesium transporter [Gammaproteobacteria bacterium]|nr:magnesium transporter [Gammaproteobacteria bacterium]
MEQDRSQKTEDQILALSDALQSGTMQHARGMLNELSPAEIAHLLESLPHTERNIIWELVDPDKEGEVLIQLGDEIRSTLIKDMSLQDMVNATEGMDVDDLADYIQALPDRVTTQVLTSLDTQNRERLEAVLSYPEDSAGGLMNTDTITVRGEVTLDVVLRYLRRMGKLPDHTDSLFVTNRDNVFIGTLPLASIVTNDPDKTVAEVMSRDTEVIKASMEDDEVAKIFETHDLISAPVVDENMKLLGRITVDDVVDVIRDEAEHSVLGMAGLTEEEDLFAPPLPSAKRRAVWLGINLITAFMASWVVSNFEDTLQKVVTIAVLMNVVASMGGIAGSQTLTLVIRGLALGQVSRSNRSWLVNKEIIVGLLNGIAWAFVIGAISVFWFDDLQVGYVIAAATIINLFVAAFSGVVIPIVMNKLNIDPAIAGNVVLTTITDIVGLFAFLGLATAFLL